MVRILVILVYLSSTILCNNAFSIDGPFCSQSNQTEDIPNTSLKTRTFYRVTTENISNRYLTYSYKSHPKFGHRYIVSDQSKRNRYTYQKSGQNYYNAQWFFLPAKGHPGWYYLANRGIPGELAAWSYKGDENLGEYKYYLILDPFNANSAECCPKLEYLFKPVKQGSSYQLELKALPDAYIAVCNQEELKGSYRWHLFVNSAEKDVAKYKQEMGLLAYPMLNFELIDEVEKYSKFDP